jgi:hypothetical protein
VTADLDDMQLQVLALRRGTGDAVLLPAVSRALDDGGRLGARADVRIGRAARGDRARTLYPGTWDLFIGLSAAGWNVRAPLRGDSFPKLGGSLDTTVTAAGQSIRFFTTDRGAVALTVWRDRPLRRFAALLPNSVRRALVRTRRKLCG